MKKLLSVILVTALLLSMFSVFAVTNVSAATVIANASPAITANVGTTIYLSNYSVVFDGASSATTSITWKNSAGSTISSFTPTSKGVTKLTATSGSKSKTIYVVAKNTSDTEYVLYEADLSALGSVSALKNQGWAFTSESSCSFSGGDLMLNSSTVYLPAWLGDFGNYGFTVNAKIAKANDNSRWFALMYRASNRSGSYNYYQYVLRNNTTASNGIEFAERTSSGYTYITTTSGEYPILTDAFRNYTVKANNGYGYYINSDQFVHVDQSTFTSKSTNDLTKGYLGITMNGGTLAISSVKVTVQAATVAKEAKRVKLVNNDRDALNTINPIANVERISSVSALDSANVAGNVYINANQVSNLSAFFEKCRTKQIIPNLYVNSTTDVTNVINAINATDFTDVTVIASNASYLKSLRSTKSIVRTGLILNPNTYATEHDIRVAVRSAPATFCVIDVKYATKKLVSELQEYAVAVWASCSSAPNTSAFVTESITAATAGVNGVITNSASDFAHAVNKHIVANSMTRTPVMIGHRGNPSQAPENTLSGFIKAYENGADVFELDVDITKDGHVVIMHDPEITRTTTYTGSLTVGEMTLSQIKSYYILDNNGKATTEKVPTLKEVCEYFKDKDCKLFIEYKGNTFANVTATAQVLKDLKMEYLVDCISFNYSLLTQMQTSCPGMSTGYLLSSITDASTSEKALLGLYSYLSSAQAINSTINPARSIVVSQGNLFATYATDRGMTVWPWTYSYNNNDAGFFSGCDGITTDDMQWVTNVTKYLEGTEIALNVGQSYSGGNVYSVTYGNKKTSIPYSNLKISVIEGEEYLTVANGQITGKRVGVAKVIFGYESSTPTGKKFVTYTQPVDIIVGNNVALNKGYTGGEVSPAGSYSASLTDGQANTEGKFDSTWYALYYNKNATADKINAPDGVGTITINLGELVGGITSARVHVWNCNANGIYPAKSIKLLTSEDGTNFTEIGELAIPASDEPAWATINTNYISAKYVRFVIETQATWTFLNEIQVYADPNYDPDSKPPFIQNIALGKDYTGGDTAITNASGATAAHNADLTDGKAIDTIDYNGGWLGLWYNKGATIASNNAPNGIGTIVIDLEKVYDGINNVKINTWLGDTVSGITAPKSIKVSFSKDGENYTNIKNIAIPAGASTSAWATADINNVSARYVKFVIETQTTWTFINEIQIFADLNYVPDNDAVNLDNVALDKSYVGGDTAVTNANGDVALHNADLTDGVAIDTIDYNGGWLGLWYNKGATIASNNAPNGIGTIIIDLEEVVDGITKVKLHLWLGDTASGISSPKSIKVSFSEDGETYGEEINVTIPSGVSTSAWANANIDNVSARYVKFVVETQTTWTFLNEIEVYADLNYVPQEPDVSDPETSDPDVSDPDVSDPEIEGTLGDVDDDGDVDAADYVLVKRAVLKTYELSEQQKIIADIDADGDVDATDYVLVKRIVLGTYKVK